MSRSRGDASESDGGVTLSSMSAVRVHGLGRTVRGADGAPYPEFRDVDLLLTPGRVIGLTGPEDGGAAAVLRVLGGLARATAGEIEFLRRPDQPPLPEDPAVRRAACLLASAAAPWFAAGLDAVLREWASFAARKLRGEAALDADLIRRFARLNEDADHVLARDPGARLRAAIAAAALSGARVVLCEVPRGILDGAGRTALSGTVREAAQRGAALVIATQDERLLAATADEVVLLFDGVITARGAPEETIPAAVAAALAEGLRR
jgi:ABC-type hemin transport system ATPase subunit